MCVCVCVREREREKVCEGTHYTHHHTMSQKLCPCYVNCFWQRMPWVWQSVLTVTTQGESGSREGVSILKFVCVVVGGCVCVCGGGGGGGGTWCRWLGRGESLVIQKICCSIMLLANCMTLWNFVLNWPGNSPVMYRHSTEKRLGHRGIPLLPVLWC